jgi:hypothetical protein
MKLSYLILNVVLVGAGIFAYDTLRSDPQPVTHTAAPLPMRVEASEPAGEEERRDIVLSGTGVEVIQARLDRLAARLDGVERTLRESPRTSAVADSGSVGSGGSGTYVPAYEVPNVGDPDTPTLRPDEVSHFRTLMDAVEKQRRDERFVQMIEGQLDRLEVSLRPDQKQQVVRETIAYRETVRQALQEAAKAGSPEKRMEAIEPIKNQYEARINEIVGGQDAQKIIENMGRYPGMGQFGRGSNVENRLQR